MSKNSADIQKMIREVVLERDELDDVVSRLASANKWRREGGGDQPDPFQLGKDIDYAVEVLPKLRDRLIEMGGDV